ncbi:MAG: GDP-mannose 4,6-dehydratase [Deltaproteobacteria bacterium]|nr:GDP-mannose 4,6-dehydratase [Deltaproteobacteria bacterium]MBI3016435.1 GDP-mannose 4,6-dehydratase [Deltaproteobacteria bacterium]
MKILVTGGAGFIGSFLVDRLVRDGHEVRIYDNLDSQVHLGSTTRHQKKPPYLNKEAEFIYGDVRDRESLAKALEGIEVVFHEAAAVGVGQSQYQIKHYMDVNTGGTANLLDILANGKHRVQKIMVAASMSSYGEGGYRCAKCGDMRPPLRTEEQLAQKKWELLCSKCHTVLTPIPIPETAERQCQSIYALSKLDQEEMVLNFGKTYNIPAVALRYFNVYGPRQSLSNPYTGVAAIFMSRIKNNHSPVVYEDGLQTRDFISVLDIVEANILAMTKPEADYQAFNVGSGKILSILDIAKVLIELYRRVADPSSVEPHVTYQFRKGDIRHCIADISKIETKLGFKPKVSFQEGMKELIRYSQEVEAIDLFDQASQELKARGLA